MEPKVKLKRAPGAGMKPRDGVMDAARYNVMLDAASLATLKQIGSGSLTLGVREAARRLIEAEDTQPFSKKRHEARGGNG